jgi:hypothetical protein
MKKITTVLKLAAASFLAFSLTACGLVPPKDLKPTTDMVWRAKIVTQLVDSRKIGKEEPETNAKYNLVPERDRGLRGAGVQFGEGWNSSVGMAFVPDHVEISQLKKGAVVDIMVVSHATLNFETLNFNRILRIVCDADDDKCINTEKDAKRYKAVIDASPPADLNEKYGLTFKRRVTPEEIKEYN